ncbi:MAG: PEP/pyruvate-binding domain-containing protein, partial [Dehalococcoidia bacterium]
MPPIFSLDDPEAADEARTGGKAASLSRLRAAGFRVPDAFVLPIATTAMLEGSGVAAKSVKAAVREALRGLCPGGEPVAVRSSAIGEDGSEHSFAGQHLTLLAVTGEESVLSAIEACADSLHGEGAVAYREARATTAAKQMAVIVQRMLRPTAAGVAFTADPVTGSPESVVVEAVSGLGEGLVSGQRAAHRWVFGRRGLELSSESALEGRPVMTTAQAREVAKLALRAEDVFGQAQDVEFAVEGETIWLLQSRPITATATQGADDVLDTPTSEADYWTSANIGEVLPGLLTPLAITAFAANADRAYCGAYQELKMLAKDECPRFVGFFYNRAFLHIDNTRLIAERALGSSGDAVEERFLGGEKRARARRTHSLKNWKHRILSAWPLLRMTRTIERKGIRAEKETLAFEKRLRALDPAGLTGAELDDLRLEISNFVAGTFATHLQASGCAGAGYDLVAKMVRPILKEQTEGRAPSLFAGMRGVESAGIPLEIWGLSRVAHETGVVERLRGDGFEPLEGSLPKPWRAAFERFLELHGHRGLFEMEPSQPSWRRDPGQVVRLVRDYLDLPEEQSPPAVLAQREVERVRLSRELMRRMNPVKRIAFRLVLRDAQKWVALRERTKSVIVRGTRLVDILMPEASDRLVKAGVVATAEDVYFLTGEEFSDALRAEASRDLRSVVARRRRDFERNRHVRLPERFRGRPTPLPLESLAKAGDVLRGTPVSPGQVTGRARVILDPRIDGPLLPGEVLIAPVTDAGWTPLFALAVGLVVDMGSALSHGSTVA